jgi:uncharacterized surface protein with fasciclin (FAS1) repeats
MHRSLLKIGIIAATGTIAPAAAGAQMAIVMVGTRAMYPTKTIVDNDVMQSNGVIHVIDRVLLAR